MRRVPYQKALQSPTTHKHDYVSAYVNDLENAVDMEAIRGARLNIAVDPLGGAGVAYWGRISERYKVPFTLFNNIVDPTFRFMSIDWDGKIRMDCSSPYAMAGLIALKDRFDATFACDSTIHDRHGVVTRSAGLLNPNHYLSVAIWFLFQHRPGWPAGAAVGKTLVSSSMIDRVAASLPRKLVEVPVGFKYFVDRLLRGALGFGGEESAGASFLRRDGTVWTTDKDGMIMEPASTGRDSGTHRPRPRRVLPRSDGEVRRSGVRAHRRAGHARAEGYLAEPVATGQGAGRGLCGRRSRAMLTTAPGNGASIGGLKVVTKNGWFAARPSGTESVYKLYAESFSGESHLRRIQHEAQELIAGRLLPAERLRRLGNRPWIKTEAPAPGSRGPRT